MTDTSIIPFGMHKGLRLIDVPASYLLWLYENGKCFGELKDYIKDNLDVIKEQAKREKK